MIFDFRKYLKPLSMKAVCLLSLTGVTKAGGVLSIENLFSGSKFQTNVMIMALFAVVALLFVVGTIKYVNIIRKRRSEKGFMTIRQYYQYKSAR